MAKTKLAFVASNAPLAQEALTILSDLYPTVEDVAKADVIVALGGDGFMLHSLRHFINDGKPIYGMNRGTIGFLMNEFSEHDLMERLDRAHSLDLRPLRMRATRVDGIIEEALAINEVSVFRETAQAARIDIRVDGVVRLSELVCDGVLLSSPAGSTAYNLSAHGPIVPIGAGVLALTPISAFRPRRWRGALLPQSAKVEFDIHDTKKRPVSAVADSTEVRDVRHVEIIEDESHAATILFDPEHSLEERILTEQFAS